MTMMKKIECYPLKDVNKCLEPNCSSEIVEPFLLHAGNERYYVRRCKKCGMLYVSASIINHHRDIFTVKALIGDYEKDMQKGEDRNYDSGTKNGKYDIVKMLYSKKIVLFCPNDNTQLIIKEIRRAKDNKAAASYIVKKCHCPQCDSDFISAPSLADTKRIKLKEESLDNIDYQPGYRAANTVWNYSIWRKHSEVNNKSKNKEAYSQFDCIVCSKNIPSVCLDPECRKPLRYKWPAGVNGEAKKTRIRYCEFCHIYYLDYGTYIQNDNYFCCLNKRELPGIAKQERQKNEQERFQSSKKQRDIKIEKIEIRDFVVRSTSFKCRSNKHLVRNIDAKINIINNKGDLIDARVPAGFCEACNVYFIMEDTYQRLKKKGTLVCRVSDEKSYLRGTVRKNGMNLANESLLMQYGYNVSQLEDLSDLRRRKILSLIIENRILTRTEVIGYLRFFINQRMGMKKYYIAIEKWSSDIDFVNSYNMKDLQQYRIGSLRIK